MQSVEEFLAYSIKVEQEAPSGSADWPIGWSHPPIERWEGYFGGCRTTPDYISPMRWLVQAFARIPELKPDDFLWPDAESPETSQEVWAADPLIGREQALEIALQAEMAGFQFYKTILETTSDPEIKMLAKEFVAEESEHVAELQKWIAAHKAGKPCLLIAEPRAALRKVDLKV